MSPHPNSRADQPSRVRSGLYTRCKAGYERRSSAPPRATERRVPWPIDPPTPASPAPRTRPLPARYGKEILGDIREGKRTLMLIHLLTVARRAERQRLERFLRLPPGQRTAAMVEDVAGMMHAHGSIGFEIGRDTSELQSRENLVCRL